MMRFLAIFGIGMLLCACGDPLSMIPGGKLSGPTVTSPAAWNDVPDTIQVEVRPSDPYSINIWGVGINQNLYIATGADGTTWSGYLAVDPRVRVRVAGIVYELVAETVTNPTERQDVTAAYVAKYDLEVNDNWVKEGLILRMDRP